MPKFGHCQGITTMRHLFGEWSATYTSNRYASPRHRDIEKKYQCMHLIFSRMFRRQEPSAIYCLLTAPSSQWTFDEVHQGDVLNRVVLTSAMYIRCDNIADDLGDPSPMFSNWSAKHQRCYGDVFACVLYFVLYLHPVIRQQNKSDRLYPWSHSAATKHVVRRAISPPFVYSPQGTMPSPWRRQAITTTSSRAIITSPKHRWYLSVARRRITDHRRLYVHI